jgi:hypothetical protein
LPSDPPFNPAWPPKDWADPNPKQVYKDLQGVGYAVYHVYLRYDVTTQSPVFDDVSVPIPLARVTNIVPSDKGSTWGKLLEQCPTPMRELKDDEVIKLGLQSVPMVFTAAELVVPKDPGQDFSSDEKDLLLTAARHELARP